MFFALGCMGSLGSLGSLDSVDPEDSLASLVSASSLGCVDFGADPLDFVDPEDSFDPLVCASPSSFSDLADFLDCVDFACDSVDALRFAADSLDSLYADSVDADDSLDFAADCDDLGCLVPADFEEPPAGAGAEAFDVVPALAFRVFGNAAGGGIRAGTSRKGAAFAATCLAGGGASGSSSV